MAIEQNITPYSQYFTGEDKSLSCIIFQADGETRQDLTGWTGLSWLVKEDPDDEDEDALVTKTLGSGITVTDAVQGVVTVTVSDDDIAELEGETAYYHELKRTDDGLETVLLFGRFQLAQAVHR